MSDKITYLIEVMDYETHNTHLVTITTGDLNQSMNEYQRNRRPFEWEKLDWKPENNSRQLVDERDME
jgi:hypothetical protein